jgi:hypothetical protein
MFTHLAKRLGVGSAGIVVALALLSASAQAELPQPIYFWGNAAAIISAPGQPPQAKVVRPSLIYLFADGSWDIEQLHWTGWGSSVAHATGISSASNGIPNEEQGKRIKTPAQITLSDPGQFQGHEVYRCFVLTDAHIAPRNDHPDGPYNCLQTFGGFSSFGPATPPAPPKQAEVEFYAPIDGGCEMDDSGVGCETYGPSISQGVRLDASGSVRICTEPSAVNKCNLGNLGEGPAFKVGKQVTVGPFRCQVLDTGVKCTVLRSGKGFLISKTRTIRIG